MAKAKEDSKVAERPAAASGVVPFEYGKEHAGGGYEGSTSADFQVPFLLLLQSQSPQVEGSGSGKELPGAKAGMFYLTSTGDLFDGDSEGVVLVPCYSEHIFNEWVPRAKGGGFRGTFLPESPEVLKAREEAKGSFRYKRGENELTETFNLYCLVLRKAGDQVPVGTALFTVTTKKIKWYKAMRSKLKAFGGSRGVPLYANLIRMKSWQDKNEQGNFKNIKFELAVEDDVSKSLIAPDSPLLALAKALKDSVVKGEAKVDYSGQAGEPAPSEGDDKVF